MLWFGLQGNRYWRYENDVVDSGYPKLIENGFDGLRGHITAALSVPQYRRRREAVYFFKRGDELLDGHVFSLPSFLSSFIKC